MTMLDYLKKRTRSRAQLAKELEQAEYANLVLQETAKRLITNLRREHTRQRQRLVNLLTFVVASAGGRVEFKDSQLAALPSGSTLTDSYDAESDSVVLQCVLPAGEGEAKPDLVVVGRPQIEVVRG